MLRNNPFWLVWNPRGRAPTYEHSTLEDATREAERLARTNQGETFIVLESVTAVVVDNVRRVDLRPQFEPPF